MESGIFLITYNKFGCSEGKLEGRYMAMVTKSSFVVLLRDAFAGNSKRTLRCIDRNHPATYSLQRDL